MRPKQVATYLSISLATLWRLNKRGDFVAKVKLSERSVGFYQEDIDSWLEKRSSTQSK